MIEEYKRKGTIQYQFGKKQTRSPSRAEAHRQAELSGRVSDVASSAASMNTQQKSELVKYLNALDIEDLEMITKDRKSTKKIDKSPIIYGAKSPWG